MSEETTSLYVPPHRRNQQSQQQNVAQTNYSPAPSSNNQNDSHNPQCHDSNSQQEYRGCSQNSRYQNNGYIPPNDIQYQNEGPDRYQQPYRDDGRQPRFRNNYQDQYYNQPRGRFSSRQFDNEDSRPYNSRYGNQTPMNSRHPQFNSDQQYNSNGLIRRSNSMPSELHGIPDDEIVQLFASLDEDSLMSVYEESRVVVTAYEEKAPLEIFPGSGISNEILYNVATAKYKYPTAVQKYAIPYILNGDDVLVTSQTGSGKTAAFMLPVLSMITKIRRSRDPSVVVLVPTHELAMQIEKKTLLYSRQIGLKIVCVYGGSPIGNQIKQLRYGCDVLIATPGRLTDILQRDTVLSLTHVRFLILDEADRMLDMGFEPQIAGIINQYGMPPSENRQTLLFSATFPRDVQELAQLYMKEILTRIEVGMQDAPSLITQKFLHVDENSKLSALLDIISEVEGQTLVFAERKISVDRIEEYLYDEGCAVVAIHGDRDSQDRLAAIRGFTSGKAKIMVATDVAARGLDIPNVAHVINLDLPSDFDTYTHRIGRTGRAGRSGIATSLWNESNAQFLNAFLAHLREEKMPIPEGLQDYDPDAYRRSTRGGRGYRGNGMRRQYSYGGNMFD